MGKTNIIKLYIKKYAKIIRNKKIIKKICRTSPFSSVSNDSYVDECTLLEGYNNIKSSNISSSKIGIYTYVESNCVLPSCLIGRYNSIGNNVKVVLGKHPINYVSMHPISHKLEMLYPYNGCIEGITWYKLKDKPFNIQIGNDVWIGDNCIIRGGVNIGDGAVIATGAVVVKDVPPYAIVGGVPAKIIKYRFEGIVIDKLLKIKWWDWPVEVVIKRREELRDVDSFIEKYYQD